MAEVRRSGPLLETILTGLRLPWYAGSGIISAALLLLLLLAAYLEGPIPEMLSWNNLRGPLLPLAIVSYVLFVHRLMERLRERAISSLIPLLDGDPGSRRAVAKGLFVPRRRWELISALAGIVCWTALSQPWRWVVSPLGFYAAGIDLLMFAILGLLVFNGLGGTVRITGMVRRHTRVDVLAANALVPVAHWSLGVSLAFLGGLSISIAFQNLENLRQWQTVAFYAALVLVAVIVFFVSTWGAHTVMVRAKRTELSVVRRDLDLGFRELRERGNAIGPGSREAVHAQIAAWAAYEHRIQSVPEWPYGARIARRLAASVFMPGVVYLLKLLFGISL
jgi:type III secretory pathway component EscS